MTGHVHIPIRYTPGFPYGKDVPWPTGLRAWRCATCGAALYEVPK